MLHETKNLSRRDEVWIPSFISSSFGLRFDIIVEVQAGCEFNTKLEIERLVQKHSGKKEYLR